MPRATAWFTGLSSTTRIHEPRCRDGNSDRWWRYRRGPHRQRGRLVPDARASSVGRSNARRRSLPAAARRTRSWTRARPGSQRQSSRPSVRPGAWRWRGPRPVPPKRRVVELSAWTKGWNTRPNTSWRQSDPGIGDLEPDRAAASPRFGILGDADPDRPFARELQRVADQVREDLPEPVRISAHHRRHVVLDENRERELLAPGRLGKQSGPCSRRSSRSSKSIDSICSIPASIFEEVQDVVDDA